MPKGNHVFNQLDKTIRSFFANVITERLKDDSTLRNTLLVQLNNIAYMSTTPENCRITVSWNNLWAFMLNTNEEWGIIHALQDDNEVDKSGDQNSKDFGKASSTFVDIAFRYVSSEGYTPYGVTPATKKNVELAWTDMINKSKDGEALTRILKVDPTKAQDAQRAERFIKGRLTEFVLTWVDIVKKEWTKYG